MDEFGNEYDPVDSLMETAKYMINEGSEIGPVAEWLQGALNQYLESEAARDLVNEFFFRRGSLDVQWEELSENRPIPRYASDPKKDELEYYEVTHDKPEYASGEWTIVGNPKTSSRDELHFALQIPDKIKDKIYNWTKDQDWGDGVELEEKDNYHITLLYIEKGYKEHKDSEWIYEDEGYSASITGIDVFGPDKNTVVLRIDSPEAKLHADDLQDMADNRDLPLNRFRGGYKPHITIAFGPTDMKLPKDVEAPKLTFTTLAPEISKPRQSSSPWTNHDPLVCPGCGGMLSEPHQLQGTNKWINSCSNCHGTYTVPPSSPLLQEFQKGWEEYPDILKQVNNPNTQWAEVLSSEVEGDLWSFKEAAEASMRLQYLPTNQAWVVMFGDQIIPIDQIPGMGTKRFFASQEEAIEGLRRVGLQVDPQGNISSLQQETAEHPDPWMDSEPGATQFPEHWTFSSKDVDEEVKDKPEDAFPSSSLGEYLKGVDKGIKHEPAPGSKKKSYRQIFAETMIEFAQKDIENASSNSNL